MFKKKYEKDAHTKTLIKIIDQDKKLVTRLATDTNTVISKSTRSRSLDCFLIKFLFQNFRKKVLSENYENKLITIKQEEIELIQKTLNVFRVNQLLVPFKLKIRKSLSNRTRPLTIYQ
jgi:hypothetical protein